jgi:hypothetical protein
MPEASEIRDAIGDVTARVVALKKSLDSEAKAKRMAEVEERMARPDFWNNQETALKDVWGKGKKDSLAILTETKKIVEKFLNPVQGAIMSQITESEITSKFFPELYLKQFPRNDRLFMVAFTQTQMFQLRIEVDCRKNSDRQRTQ